MYTTQANMDDYDKLGLPQRSLFNGGFTHHHQHTNSLGRQESYPGLDSGMALYANNPAACKYYISITLSTVQ